MTARVDGTPSQHNQRSVEMMEEIRGGHRHHTHVRLVIVLLSYCAGAVLSLAISSFLFDQPVYLQNPFLWAGFIFVPLFYLYELLFPDSSRPWRIVWCLIGALGLLNIAFQFFHIQSYGDADAIVEFIAQLKITTRWLIGNAVLVWLHAAIFEFPAVKHAVSDPVAATAVLIRTIGLLVMISGSLFLLKRWPGRLSILFSIFAPTSILFSLGTLEYYPLVAPLFIFALAWTVERPLNERSPYVFGILTGILFCAYIGFVPYAVIMLVCFVLASPAQALKAITATFFTVLSSIVLFWPHSVTRFIVAQYRSMNFGNNSIAYPPYKGLAAGPDSIFFSWSHSLSFDHLGDLALMIFFGAGPLSVFLLLSGAVVAGIKFRNQYGSWLCDTRFLTGSLIALWSFYYCIRMIPKLGPIEDIGLFFPCYIAISYFAGNLFDVVLQSSENGRKWKLVILAAFLGSSFVVSGILALNGIQLIR